MNDDHDEDDGPMYEDWQMDEDFQTESVGDFISDKDPDEIAFIHQNMVPCRNCGELRPRTDPYIQRSGMCYLCSKSEFHSEKRAAGGINNGNWKAVGDLVNRWENSR